MSREVLLNNYVSVRYQEASSLLLIKWRRQITLQERKDIFLWAYNFSRSHTVQNWLIDDEEIFLISMAEKDWVLNEWTQLAATTPIRKIAVVTPVHIPGLLANINFTAAAQLKYKALGHTQHEVFTEHHLAIDWLRGKS